MEIAKAVILASRGCDDRPWPAALAGAKHLFPVANRPIVFHCLAALRASGVLEVVICVGPQESTAIRQAVGDGRQWGLSVGYAEWRREEGLGGALAITRGFCGEEPVLVQRGDALLRDRLHPFICAFAREPLDALELRLGAAREAPVPGRLLSPRAVSALIAAPAEADPAVTLRERGGDVRVAEIDGCLACDGGQDDLLETNRCMLEGLETSIDPASLEDTRIQGPVVIAKTATVKRSLIRGPVVIGPGARISDAYVGPYTSIGAGVRVEGSQIEHSIVLRDAELLFVGSRLESSVVGRSARIARSFDLPGSIRMSVGEGAEVTLS